MRRRSTLLLNLAIVLSLAFSGILSGLLVPTPVATGTASAPVAAPGEVSPEPASRKVKRERKHDRKKKDRKQDRKQKDRKADRKQKDKKQDRKKNRTKGDQQTEDVRVGNWEEQCTGSNAIRLQKSELCTHGPDPAPPGFDVGQPVTPLSDQAAAQESAPVVCEPDGQTGFRVEVLYLRGPSSPPLSDTLRASIRGWVSDMDEIFQDNAEATGPTRNLRFVHDASCQLVVADIVVTSSALNDFGEMIAQLENTGRNRTDRIYLSFVEAFTYCGIGTLWNDDRANGTSNWNNVGPSYSRVDKGCWEGWIAAHEVMHNLGGVQLSAANTSNGFHCTDEYDIMCYQDGRRSPPMREVCTPEVPLDATLLDCNHDDYYHTNPADGSYLDTRWNPANNRFLIGAPDTPLPTDFADPAIEWIAPVGNDDAFDVSAGDIALEAAATDNVGVASVEFWRWDNEDGRWVFLGEDNAAPYESSVSVGALSLGENVISADAYDEAGNWIDEWIYLNRVNIPPPDTEAPAVTWTVPVGNDQQHQVTTGSIALEATATDNVGVARVEFKRYDNVGQTWLPISTDQSAPYTSSINVGALSLGGNDLSANAFDAAGNSSSKVIHINRSAEPPPVPPPPPPVAPPVPPQADETTTPTVTNTKDKKKDDKKDNKKGKSGKKAKGKKKH